MSTDTLFRPQAGGGGSGTTDYIKDVFLDVSRPATSNTGYSSTVSSNPLGQYFFDTDAPQYGVKTLYVKTLTPITDKSKWINGKPTFEIGFTETFPQVKAYAYGNVRLLDTETGPSVFLTDIDDSIGIVGNIRQVAWRINTTDQTGTVTPYLDESAGSALTFGSAASDSVNTGVVSYNSLLQSASLASNNLHNFRIEADQYSVTRVSAISVYFENATSNIQCQPGNTYVNKNLSSSTSATALSLPTLSGRLGGKTVVYKTSSGSYALSTYEPLAIETVGTGTNATNLVNVTTGQGGSFPIGTMIASISSGSSYYFGIVTNQSTDTLTVSPTLAFGISGPLYKYGYAGTTFTIGASNYKVLVDLNPATLQSTFDPLTFGMTNGTIYYQDPESRFRIWGSNLTTYTFDGVAGLGFMGASGFLQIDGRFAALDFEHNSLGILHATFSINGLNCFGLNAGFSGVFKKTIMSDSGIGWNSVVISPGASYAPTLNAFSKFTFYDVKNSGISYGILAELPKALDPIPRAAENATLMQLGSLRRHYADQLYLLGAWTRAVGASFVGGVGYYGASTNSTLKFQYYGTNFAFLGTAGASMTATLDGASIAFNFNVMKSVTTLGWHTVQLAYNAGSTATIEGIEVLGPQTEDLVSTQNYNSDARLTMVNQTYVQSQTPGQAKDGDLWVQSPPGARGLPVVWIKAFGYWLQLPITTWNDDPNLDELFIAGGITDSGTTRTATAYRFNGFSWSATVSASAARSSAGLSSSQYNTKFFLSGGDPGPTATVESFNKASWTGETALPAARDFCTSYQAFGFLYTNKGSTDGSSTNAQSQAYKYNGVSWATPTAWAGARFNCYCMLTAGVLDSIGGGDTAGNATNLHETRTGADSVGSTTVIPVTVQTSSSANINSLSGIVSTGTGGAPPTAVAYSWNGSAWSAALTAPFSQQASSGGYSPSRGLFFGSGGSDGSNNPNSNSYSYNGVSFVTNSNLVAARRITFSGCI